MYRPLTRNMVIIVIIFRCQLCVGSFVVTIMGGVAAFAAQVFGSEGVESARC